MIEQEIAFNFKARYYKLGEINASTKHVWFVLHGYGQLAQYFIRKFNKLEENNICVIAPEGLSRFYLEELQAGGRKNNRVGATWMTRENRLMDIANYIEYLNSVYLAEVKTQNIPVTVLGFSQGSATASRWVLSGSIAFQRLILWSGIFPPDMNFEGASRLDKKQVYLVYGKDDPFLNDNRFVEMHEIAKKLRVNVQEVTFNGEHDIDQPTLLRFIKFPS